MNKITLLGAVAVATGALVSGHSSASAQTIGFKVGPTFSTLHYTESATNDGVENMTSFGGGGFLRFGLAGLAMQGEVLALTKGDTHTGLLNTTVKSKRTYLEVPILARFSMGTSHSTPYLMVGPSFAYELSCKQSVDDQSNDCEAEGADSPRPKLDIGATGVAGVEFKMGGGALLVEGRYTHGLTNLDKNDNVAGKITNRSFAVMAGYSFTLQ